MNITLDERASVRLFTCIVHRLDAALIWLDGTPYSTRVSDQVIPSEVLLPTGLLERCRAEATASTDPAPIPDVEYVLCCRALEGLREGCITVIRDFVASIPARHSMNGWAA